MTTRWQILRPPRFSAAVLLLLGCASPTDVGRVRAPAAINTFHALAFDGVAQFAEVPDAASLDLSERWTLEAWVNPADAASGTFQHLLSKWNGAGDASYTMEIHAGHLRAAIHDGVSPSQAVESFDTVRSGAWTHVAVSYDLGRMTLYINGQVDRTVTEVLRPMNSTRPLSIGREGPPYNGWYYRGLMDEVRVWRIARSSAQIRESLYRPLATPVRGLVGYWRMDEGEGQFARDRSELRNHARLGSTASAEPSDPVWVPEGAPLLR